VDLGLQIDLLEADGLERLGQGGDDRANILDVLGSGAYYLAGSEYEKSSFRGLADLPLKGSEGEPRTETRPAFSEQDQGPGARPDMEEERAEEEDNGDEAAEEEVPA
jgi:hypothetical protein